jgi:N-acetylmuramoyl-L-alanine amidase
MIKLVYPPPNHQTAAPSTFVIGSVPPGQSITLNGQPLLPNAQGYFAQSLPLSYGVNTFTFALTPPAAEVRTLKITRPAPVAVPPGSVLPHIMPTPTQALMPGDWLTLTCVAGAGQTLQAHLLDPQNKPYAIIPLKAKGKAGFVDNRVAQFAELTQTKPQIANACVYTGTWQRPPGCAAPGPLSLTLAWHNGQNLTPDPASITLWDSPQYGRIVTDLAVMRTSPPEGSRLTPQRPDTWVVVTGQQGDWYKVRLSAERSAWLKTADVVLQGPLDHRQVPAQTIKTQPQGPHSTVVEMPGLGVPVPHHIESKPGSLTVDWFGVVSHCDFIHYHPNETVVKRIDWSQPNADTFRLVLDVPRLCGYNVQFTPQGAALLVKQLPKRPRILIDPGHGGTESGSMGPDGLPEKALNLAVALKVAQVAQRAGLDVTLTRQTDTTVSLTERTAMAEAFDMVLSLHHNALPDGRDPQKAKGLSTYYYHAMAKPLADQLATQLSQAIQTPLYGVFYDSLALTRIPHALAVLIEIGFMTHPDDYANGQSADRQDLFAQALVKQVMSFMHNF